MNEFTGGVMLIILSVALLGGVGYMILHPILCGLATLKKCQHRPADAIPVEKNHPSAFHHV